MYQKICNPSAIVFFVGILNINIFKLGIKRNCVLVSVRHRGGVPSHLSVTR